MRVRVATLNAWAIPEPIGRDVSARIDAIGRRLPSLQLDVIAFQEVWTSDAARRLREAGRLAGLRHSWFDEGRFGARTVGGLLVLSRFPIEGVEFEPFSLQGEPKRVVNNLEYVSGKGFAAVRLKTPKGPLVVVNTHLHARYGYASHKHVPHRTSQAIQLATRFIDRQEPMVVVGDFNFREGEVDYQVLTDILGLSDVAAALGNRQNTTLRRNPYRKSKGIDKRKDYVFTRGGVETTVVGDRIERTFDELLEFGGHRGSYSDHAGLIATFDLETAVSPSRPHPAPGVFDVVAGVLQEGERLARARQSGDRQASGIGLGLAAAATLGAVPKRMSRRRMLRGILAGTAVLSLTPGVGLRFVSEVLLPDEIEAFQVAADQLARLRDPSERFAHTARNDASA